MAELGTGNGTSIPTTIDTRQTFVNVANPDPDSSSRMDAEAINDALATLIALETDLYRGRVYDVRTYTDFATAVSSIGSVTEVTLLVSSNLTISTAVTVTSNIHVKVIGAGKFTKASSGTLTFNGPFEAPMKQVFSGFAPGEVTFGTSIKSVHHEWFGSSANNLFYGIGSGGNLTLTGLNNTVIGKNTLKFNTTGNSNTAVGLEALRQNTTGNYNTAVGVTALAVNTSGYANVAIGVNALSANTTGESNTAVGMSALGNLTTGTANVAVGTEALLTSTTGISNTAVGNTALKYTTTGTSNTAVGSAALDANTTGSVNTAVGTSCLISATTANSNTGVGFFTLYTVITGQDNTAIGAGSLAYSTGNNNVAVGSSAGSNLTSGNNNIVIGQNAQLSGVGVSNETVIGNSSTTKTKLFGAVVCGAESLLATNATDGFLYVPACAGTPTGVPISYTGKIPIIVNSTNNKLYFYSNSAWRDAGP